MYNTDLPRRAELPSSAQLKRSTWIAGIAASAILVLVVLPSEYAIDPTGVGGLLGLTQMGEIKTQLSMEAAADEAAASAKVASQTYAPADPTLTARLDRIEAMLQELGATASTGSVSEPASVAQVIEVEPPIPAAEEPRIVEPTAERLAAVTPEPAVAEWQDEVSLLLTPGEGAEVKLVMDEGAQADFYWTANGSVVNYDTHGDGGGNSISYEKGRSVGEQEGVLEAAFTGNHGWFWRNRGNEPLTLTLRTRGAYSSIKRPT